MAMIELSDVCFSYSDNSGENPAASAVADMTLSIEQGEFVAVIGRNGSGKSTFAKLITGIVLPQKGTVHVNGLDTKNEDELYEIRRTCGMVFQNPDNQLVATVVEEDVAFAPENMGLPTEEIRKRVDEALDDVGMTEWRLHAPHLLSGGQKQRVAIAGVLAMHPQCIILDEPTAMLDPSGRKEVLDTVLRLNREKGVTVILITHHMNEACLASRMIVMEKGRCVLDAAPDDVFGSGERMASFGLDEPQTVDLLKRLKSAGVPVNTALFSAEECAQEIINAFQHGKSVV